MSIGKSVKGPIERTIHRLGNVETPEECFMAHIIIQAFMDMTFDEPYPHEKSEATQYRWIERTADKGDAIHFIYSGRVKHVAGQLGINTDALREYANSLLLKVAA